MAADLKALFKVAVEKAEDEHMSDDQDIFGGRSSGDDVKPAAEVKEAPEPEKPAEISEDDIF